jgi:hypothetical protein
VREGTKLLFPQPRKSAAPQPQKRQSGHSSPERVQRRVINRQEREMPDESSVWFNLGFAAISIAAGAATAAATVVHDPIIEAVLWTVAACAALAALSYFLAHHDVNRGRRVKRSEVIEEYMEKS